jgi:hypothetical protein
VELRVETGGIAGVSKSARELGRERLLCPELGSESEESLIDESESSPEDDDAEERMTTKVNVEGVPDVGAV